LASAQCIDLPRSLKELFPDSFVERLARETGFLKRQRKLKPVVFFWTLLLGFAGSSSRTVASFRRSYEAITGETFVPSSFYDRFNRGLVIMLKAAVQHALESFRLAWTDQILAPFRDVIIADATVIKLFDGLKRAFPGCRTNSAPAAVKLHAFLSVKGAGRSTVAISSERVHEKRKLRVGPWVRDNLLLFDLGFYHFQLFSCIARNRGYFLTRLKENANPIITALHRRVRGNSVAVEGRRLQDILPGLKRQVLDVEAEVAFQRRVYGGRRRLARERYRVVAIRDDRTSKYHTYLTNIPPEVLSAEEVASSYRGRWVIELLFKELKTGYRIDEVPSARKDVAEALLHAAVLTFLVSRRLFHLLSTQDRAGRFRVGRWWALFRAHAATLLAALLQPERAALLIRTLLVTMKHELVDPHRKRRPLLVEAFCPR
jgi:putative transposase